MCNSNSFLRRQLSGEARSSRVRVGPSAKKMYRAEARGRKQPSTVRTRIRSINRRFLLYLWVCACAVDRTRVRSRPERTFTFVTALRREHTHAVGTPHRLTESPSAHPTPHAPKHIYEASICHTNLYQTTRFACTEIQMRLAYGREGLLHPCRCSNRCPRSAA